MRIVKFNENRREKKSRDDKPLLERQIKRCSNIVHNLKLSPYICVKSRYSHSSVKSSIASTQKY